MENPLIIFLCSQKLDEKIETTLVSAQHEARASFQLA